MAVSKKLCGKPLYVAALHVAEALATKKAITVTADNKTKVVGAVDPALTYKVASGSLEPGEAGEEADGRHAVGQGANEATCTSRARFAGYERALRDRLPPVLGDRERAGGDGEVVVAAGG